MPFKIVSTRRKGRVELCTVPETWEIKGILRWPKMYGDILAKNDTTQPQPDWLNYNCIVKRRNYLTYEEAEAELTKMLGKSDTDTDYCEQSYHRTSTPQQLPNLNAAFQQKIIKSGYLKKRTKPQTSTMQASQIVQGSPTIQISPMKPSSPIIPANPTIPASPITQTSYIIQADPTIPASSITQTSYIVQADPTIPESPITHTGYIIQADPTISVSPTIPASSITQTSSTIQADPAAPISPTTPASSITQTASTIQADLFMPASSVRQTRSRIQADPTMYTTFYAVSPEHNNEPIILAKISEILENQNKIIKRLSEISVHLQEIENRTEDTNITPLREVKGRIENKKMIMHIVDSLETLEQLEKTLSCPKIRENEMEKYSILCSKAPGSGYNCAYRLLDTIFSKEFLCQCSWTGGSRGENIKIGFKKYKNILQFFFEMIRYWDNKYTIQENEIFFKTILRNASKRKASMSIRQSTKKTRLRKDKALPSGDTQSADVDDAYDGDSDDTGENNKKTNNEHETMTDS